MTDQADSASAHHTAKLLIHAIEEKAIWTPHNIVIRYPAADWETAGYRSINAIQYAKAIDTVAHWLDSQLGSAADTNTVAYFGPSDPRYAIILPAVIKTRRRVGFILVMLVPFMLITRRRFSFRMVETQKKACKSCLHQPVAKLGSTRRMTQISL
jgi:hypothetical protein